MNTSLTRTVAESRSKPLAIRPWVARKLSPSLSRQIIESISKGFLLSSYSKPWLLLLIVAATVRLAAATAKPAVLDAFLEPNRPYFSKWDTDDGLPHNRIHNLEFGANGYLWLGTYRGLARFNGERFDSFGIESGVDLKSQFVLWIASAEDGMWFQTGRELVWQSWFSQTNQRYAYPQNADDLRLSWCDAEGLVWGQEHDSVIQFGTADQPILFLRNRDENFQITQVIGGPNNSIYALSDQGLWRLDSTPDSFYQQVNLGPYNQTRILMGAVGIAGDLWLGAEGALLRYDPRIQKTERIAHGIEWRDDRMQWLLPVEAGVLAPFGPTRLARIDRRGVQPLKIFENPSQDWVNSARTDSSGRHWFGSEASGLYRSNPQGVRQVVNKIAPLQNIWALHESSDGSLWIGADEGIRQLGAVATEMKDASNKRPFKNIRSITEDQHGDVWIGAAGDGVWVQKRNQFEQLQFPGGYSGNKVRVIHADRNAGVWIGTSKGLYHAHKGKVLHMGSEGDLAHEDIWGLHQEASGRLWIGTYGAGLFTLKDGELIAQNQHAGFPSNFVWEILQDSKGLLWFATANGLVCRYRQSYKVLTKAHGLFRTIVNSMIEDDHGQLWFGTDDGVFSVSRESLIDLMDRKRSSVSSRILDAGAGMPSPETNGQKSHPASLKLSDGRVLFATTNGLAVIDPTPPVEVPTHGTALVSEIRIDGDLLWLNQPDLTGRGVSRDLIAKTESTAFHERNRGPPEYHFSPGTGRLIEIDFDGLNFLESAHLHFQYRLHGYDETWQDSQGRHTAIYTNLRPGTYTFEITPRHGKQPSGSSNTFRFTLRPHIHETMWFRTLVSATLLTAIAMGSWFRLNYVQRKKELENQAKRIEEREALSRDLHDGLGGDLTRICFLADRIATNQGASTRPDKGLYELRRHCRNLATALSSQVYLMKVQDSTPMDFLIWICQYLDDFLSAGDVRLRTVLPQNLPTTPLQPDTCRMIFAIIKEAATNTLRHAKSHYFEIKVMEDNGHLVLFLRDDGCGITTAPTTGNGIQNILSRVDRLGGHVELQSSPSVSYKIRLPVDSINRYPRPVQTDERKQ